MYKSVKRMMQENEKKDSVDTAGVQLDTNNENKGKKKKKCC